MRYSVNGSHISLKRSNHLLLQRLKASVIISFYKNIPALELVLQGLARQSSLPDEVIVAEDDCAPETREYINDRSRKLPFQLVHLHQEVNDGFRKNEMMNKAYRAARNEIVAFLDGDCIPHKHWLKENLRHVRPQHPVFGRRVMVSPALTAKLYDRSNIAPLSILHLCRTGSKRMKYAIYLPFMPVTARSGMWGCNWACYVSDLNAIDGFDEQYVRPGIGEDVDVEWRMNQAGIHFNSVRQQALVYHLHHESHYDNEDVAFNEAILRRKQDAAKQKV